MRKQSWKEQATVRAECSDPGAQEQARARPGLGGGARVTGGKAAWETER